MLKRLSRASRALTLSLPRYHAARWSGGGRRALASRPVWQRLPLACPGCGAFSQTVEAESAGYYGSPGVKEVAKLQARQAEDAIFQQVMGEKTSAEEASESVSDIPICDRCHDLRYQSRGTSIIHPSMESIHAIIEESPHRNNHIYHVLDAADFPLSLIPNLPHSLNLPRLRTQNRRSKHIHYLRGRVAELSFIITRSDLLAPEKEQVDRLMPYLQHVLRDALARADKKVRLGNVRCVSAKRGWWTKTVKEDIWSRGAAGWMVGKVNVGKSALFEVVFPKGRSQETEIRPDVLREREREDRDRVQRTGSLESAPALSPGELAESEEKPVGESLQETELQLDGKVQDENDEDPLHDVFSLLPPAQPETAYPTMPLISSLPGTTASPIRIPFGGGKGELIDLPGVHRTSLEEHILTEHRKGIVMNSRVVPEQYILRSGQSLLLGGLIRITPNIPEGTNMLAYPFVPPTFDPHLTGTHKAIAIQTGVHSAESKGREGEAYTGTINSVATDKAKTNMRSAGTFKLEWNVTKPRAGPLTDPVAGKQKANNLPFIVYSCDILIESVGWVELVCQVRKRSESLSTDDALSPLEHERDGGSVPEVEVFSPEGKYIGVRRPMNAWLLCGKANTPARAKRARRGMSMSVQRRREGGKRSQVAHSY